jgi:hypothetical protein
VKPSRRLARVTAATFSLVVCAVAANQVLNANKLSWKWAIVALCLATIATVYGEMLSPEATGTASSSGEGRGQGRRAYLRQVGGSVRDMETIGVATQGEYVLRMRQVYVDVSLVPRPPQDTAREPFVGKAKVHGERRTLHSFLEGGERRVLAVIGGPGSGKTTLVRNTALELCRPRIWRRRPLPVLLYLRDHAAAILAEDPTDLGAVAASSSWLTGKISPTWIRHQLDKGGCLVLLDGLDEVTDEVQRGRVISWVGSQIGRFPVNDYVLTSRPHGYQSNPLPNADVLQVRRFTGDQIAKFLHAWYEAIERRAYGASDEKVRETAKRNVADLLDRLRREPALYDLAANPLLLTMIANVHRYKGALPGSRAALYAEMCEVLLHRRQEAKKLDNPSGLSGEQKEHVVRTLALTMMTRRIRDIPVSDACEAIAFSLRQVSLDVAPKDFLDEVHKSGLLVEREHGIYSFAHLTLQEYLASAQIRDAGRADQLTAAVDDPWWRETTLLWVARADATELIRACLSVGTVRALSLAFACADQARQAAPEVRRELDDLLANAATEQDEDRRRLIAAVRAAHNLHDVLLLRGDVPVCVRPVAHDLYDIFVREERAAGLHTPLEDLMGNQASGDNRPAMGMSADDADRFLRWLNALFDDGTAYRLPTIEEAADPAIDLIPALGDRSIWVRKSEYRPIAFRPKFGAVHYKPDFFTCYDLLRVDREHSTRYLRWVIKGMLGSSNALAFVATGSIDEAQTFDLIIAIAIIRTLVRAPLPPSVRAAAQALRLRTALDVDLAYDEARAEDFELPVLNGQRDRRNLHSLSHELDLRLAGEIKASVYTKHVPFDALDRVIDQVLGLDGDFAQELERAIDRIIDRVKLLVYTLTDNPNFGSLRVPLNALPWDEKLSRDLDAALQDAQNVARIIGSDPVRHADHFSLAIERIRALLGRAKELRVVVIALADLLLSQDRPPRSIAEFDNFLHDAVESAPNMDGRVLRDPADVLRLAWANVGAAELSHSRSNDRRAAQVDVLLKLTYELVNSITSRVIPADGHTLACARIGVLAAMVVLREMGNKSGVSLLAEAWHGLVHPGPREIVLLLVRA